MNIRYLIAPFITFILIVIFGTNLINGRIEIDNKLAPYTETKYDFIVHNPSDVQISDFELQNHIDSALPAYNFKTEMSANKDVYIIYIKNYSRFEETFFSSLTLIEGEFSKDGIVLDKIAAIKLGLSVGDFVNYSMNGNIVSLEVSGIVLGNSLMNYDKGIALAHWKDDYDSFFENLKYTLAFIDSNEVVATKSYLNNYVPLADLQSQTEYTLEYKENNQKPPGYSDSQWDLLIENLYNDYYNDYMDNSYDSYVVNKTDYESDMILSYENELNSLDNNLLYYALIIPVVYLIIQIIMIILDQKNIQKSVNSPYGFGYKKTYKLQILFHIIYIISVTIISIIILSVIASRAVVDYSYNSIIYSLTLPLFLSYLIIVFYLSLLFKNIRPNKTFR